MMNVTTNVCYGCCVSESEVHSAPNQEKEYSFTLRFLTVTPHYCRTESTHVLVTHSVSLHSALTQSSEISIRNRSLIVGVVCDQHVSLAQPQV